MRVAFAAAVLLLTLAVSSSVSDEGTGSIEGFVTDENGIPLVGATVLLVDDQLGAMTDVTGAYSIHDIPEGKYWLEARMVGMETGRTAIVVIPGKTLNKVFRLHHNWPFGSWEPDPAGRIAFAAPDSLLIRNLSGRPSDHLVATYRGLEYPTTRLLDNLYQIAGPAYGDYMYLRFPWSRTYVFPIEERGETLELELAPAVLHDDSPEDVEGLTPAENPLCVADLTSDEWIAPGYAVERTILDPLEFGIPKFRQGGLLDAGTAFRAVGDSEEWAVCLVYYPKIVLLTENSPPLTTHLGTMADRYRIFFSPSCEHVLVRSAWRAGTGRDWVSEVVETGTGVVRVWKLYESEGCGTGENVIPVSPYPHHLLSDNGSLVYVLEDTVRMYDSYLRETFQEIYPGHSFFCHENAVRSSDGSVIALLGILGLEGSREDRRYRLLVLTNEGNILCSRSVDWGEMDISRNGSVLAFSTCEGVLLVASRSGLVLEEIGTGFPCGYAPTPLLSPEGSYLAYHLRSTETGDEATRVCGLDGESGIRTFEATDRWGCPLPVAVSESGWVLLRLNRDDHDMPEGHTAMRLALLDQSGNLVWMSPERFVGSGRFHRQFPWELASISSEGNRVIFTDGDWFHVIEVTEDDSP